VAYALILIKPFRSVRHYAEDRLLFSFNLLLEKLLDRLVFVTVSHSDVLFPCIQVRLMVPQRPILESRQKPVVVNKVAVFITTSLLRQLNDILALSRHDD
jgi:hypothetical protein